MSVIGLRTAPTMLKVEASINAFSLRTRKTSLSRSTNSADPFKISSKFKVSISVVPSGFSRKRYARSSLASCFKPFAKSIKYATLAFSSRANVPGTRTAPSMATVALSVKSRMLKSAT